MPLSAAIVWELRATASANNVNGGGFKAGASGTDYSQQDAAQLNPTDLACADTSTTLTSAAGGFTAAMVGNVIHITAGTNFVVGWYEITAYTNANTVTIDRTAASAGLNASAGTGYVGGAMSLNSALDSDFFSAVVPGNTIWMKNGSFTMGESFTGGNNGTAANPIFLKGYNATRGDDPTGTNRPTLTEGALSFWLGQYWQARNIIFKIGRASCRERV